MSLLGPWREKVFLLFLIYLISLFLSLPAHSETKRAVGKLMFTIGKVVIENNQGKGKRVRRGAKIFEGDIIKTNKKGQAQIKFIDGARISIRSNSIFKVEAYQYNKSNKKDGKSELSLLKGGIRAITGAIGKSNKKSYKMRTVVATIGIRGTDYSLMICNQDCAARPGGGVNNGLYVGVVSGGVTLHNDAGSMDLAPNQYAMIGSISSVPKILPKPPSFLMFDKTSASQSERRQVSKKIAERKQRLLRAKNRVQKRKESNRRKRNSKNSTLAKLNIAKKSNRSDSRNNTVNKNGQQQKSPRSRNTARNGNNRRLLGTPRPSSNKTSGSLPSANPSLAGPVSETPSASDGKAAAGGTSLDTILDNRYEDPSKPESPSADSEVFVDSGTAQVDPGSESSDDQLTQNTETDGNNLGVEPDVQSLVTSVNDSLVEAIAVGVVDEVTADEGDTTPEPSQTVDDNIVTDSLTDINPDTISDPTQTELFVEGVNRFFRSIFGAETNQYEAALVVNGNKVSTFYQADTSASNQTSFTEYSQGTATLTDFGQDPETGLSWGRWSPGNITQTLRTMEGDSATVIDMSNQSLHWIVGPENPEPIQLPITGVRNFDLVGNTNPTDNFGNIGVLGSASLTANFDQQTVDANVDLSINQRVWQGSQTDIPLDMSNGQFMTNQLNVDVPNGVDARGSIAGGLVDGVTNGAGFTYSMDATVDGELNQINGTAVFKEAP